MKKFFFFYIINLKIYIYLLFKNENNTKLESVCVGCCVFQIAFGFQFELTLSDYIDE
jgi:hypothetical protein